MQRIIAISLVIRRDAESYRHFEVRTLGSAEDSERELLRQFFGGLAKYTPTLVSWNGSGFDLPVLHYRALLHGISAPRYWEVGDHDRDFRYNSYLSRYHWRHTDLMDVLAGFSPRANAPLDEIASLLGFPGKMGMDGSKVWGAFQNGEINAIRDYCETDVLNTYLVYLRFELMRGRLDDYAYQQECELVRAELAQHQAERPHLGEFLRVWSNPVLPN